MSTPSSQSLVILLHGVGADGANLRPLGETLQPVLPRARFVAPNAPEPFEGGGSGRQWFSIVSVNDANRGERIEEARAGFDRVIAREIERAGFAGQLDRVALFGFSQGSILSLDALLTGRWPVAAVVAASGSIATPPGPKPAVKTPVLLLHGDLDEVIPAVETVRAKRVLADLGFAVEAHVYPGLGHSISLEGLQAAAAFLAKRLPGAAG